MRIERCRAGLVPTVSFVAVIQGATESAIYSQKVGTLVTPGLVLLGTGDGFCGSPGRVETVFSAHADRVFYSREVGTLLPLGVPFGGQ